VPGSGLSATLTVVSLIGAVQGLLLGAAILARRRAEPGGRLLGLLLLLGGSGVAIIALSHAPIAAAWVRQLTLVEYSAWLCLGPTVYFYMHRATGGRAAWALALHFTPAAVWLGQLSLHAGGAVAELWWPPILGLIGYQVLYTAISTQLLAERWSATQPSGIHRFWTRAWLAVLFLQHAAQIVRYAWAHVAGLEDVVPATGAVAFFGLTVLGFLRSGLLGAEARRQRPRYAGSTLSRERAGEIERRLRDALDREKRHLETDLTLERLADDLGVARGHLSQVINERFAVGFLELLQAQRVEEARRLLDGPEGARLTIEAVAARSGFNSRSAFYEAFRRATGRTPAPYRDRA
jgi:AraC-like DNA-binding protein